MYRHPDGFLTHSVIHFVSDAADHSYSPEYFAAHSEHVVIETVEGTNVAIAHDGRGSIGCAFTGFGAQS